MGQSPAGERELPSCVWPRSREGGGGQPRGLAGGRCCQEGAGRCWAWPGEVNAPLRSPAKRADRVPCGHGDGLEMMATGPPQLLT